MVSALSVAGGFTMSMGIGNFGVFIGPMSHDLGIGNTPFGLGLTARMLGFAVSGPVIGRLLDRYGTRGPLSIAVAVFGGSVASLALIDEGWQLVSLLFFMGLLGFWGSSTLYFTVMASQWFIRKRGKALSVMFVGFPVGIAVSVPVSQAMVDALGWRTAWAVLGVVGATAVLLIAQLVLRSRPEEMGLAPDGTTEAADAGGAPEPDVEHSWTVHDAVRTGAFWRLGASFGTIMLGMTAIGLFWVPYFISLGFSAERAAWALAVYALSQAGMSVLLAPFVDRVQPRFLALLGFGSFIASFLLMIQSEVMWQMFATAFLGGAGVGAGMLLQAHMWPGYFGRKHIGAIRGAAMPLTLAFSGTGSAATGMIFDATNSYVAAWLIAIGLLVIGGMLMALTPKPRPRVALERGPIV